MAGALLGKNELATYLGINPATITQWVAKGCPYVTKGGQGRKWEFNSKDVGEWWRDWCVQQALGDIEITDLDEARRRKLVAEAGLAELELQKARGDVVEIENIASVVGEEYANVRAKLLSLPTKIAPLVTVEDTEVQCMLILERAMNEALEELSVDRVYTGGELETGDFQAGPGQPEATAQAHC